VRAEGFRRLFTTRSHKRPRVVSRWQIKTGIVGRASFQPPLNA
jgi:hypothetical protein